MAENCVFFIPLSYLAPTLPMFPFEFRGEVRLGKTRVMGLPCGVSFMILASTVFVQSTRVTDGRPDRIAITYMYTRYSIYAVARKNRTNGL